MIDSLTKLGRSAPKLILLALVQTFQHLLEESVLLLVRKQPIIGLLLNAVVKVNFIEKTSSNKRSKYTRHDKSYHKLIYKNLL